jgi:hypothetical protein
MLNWPSPVPWLPPLSQKLTVLGKLLDPVVQAIYNIKVAILVKSDARGPVQLAVVAAVLAETAEV